MFSRAGIDGVCREIAHRGGERMVEWTKRNTPIGHQPFAENYVPGHLRASIEQKLLVVHPSARGMVYESGAETNVDYAPYVEEGTGLYGPYRRMYEIRPKNPDGWLRWIDPHTGQPVFAKRVMHPGSPGQHMFAIGAHMTEDEFNIFAERIVAAWARRREREFEAQPRIHIGRVA
jgi:hypothetical protein